MRMTAGRAALELTADMLALAAKGEWREVEEAAVALEAMLLQVLEHERRDIISVIHASIEDLRRQTESERDAITAQLSALRRGREASSAYRSTAATGVAGEPARLRAF